MAQAVTRAFIRGRQLAAFALVAATVLFAALTTMADVRAYRAALTDLAAAEALHGELGEVLAALALFTVAPGEEAETRRAALTPTLEAMRPAGALAARLMVAACGFDAASTPFCDDSAVLADSLRRDFDSFVTLSLDLAATSAMRVGPGAPRLQVLLQLAHHVLLPKLDQLIAALDARQAAHWEQLMRGSVWRAALVCAVALAAALLLLMPLERSILRAQAALERETLRAQQAERSKGAFLANMSHEIRTALNGVIGVAELLGRTRLDPAQSEYLQIMGGSGASLMRLINDILDFSKLGAGELAVEVARFEPRRALVEAAQLAAPLAAAKGLALDLDIDPATPRTAMGDGVRLRQIVSNLVQNAIKFTAQGRVDVAAEWRAPSRTLLLSVRDTGVGIPADKLETVFEAFQQVDNGLTPRHHGTGLGLAIARMLAEKMGGRLSVDSVEGEGTCFTVALPLGATPEATAAASLAGRRVALVGPDGPRAAALRRTLLDAGAELRPADAADVARLDAIVFDAAPAPADPDDARPPEATALALGLAAGLWRRIAPGARLVALVQPGLATEAPDGGLDAMLTVPVDPDALLAAVAGGAANQPSDARPPVAAGLRVLVADDNPVNRMIAERLLDAMGCLVDTVEDGRAAVEAAMSRPYDLVLMDVTMPVMNGLEASGEIRRREAATGRRTPIVALTAHALDEHRERCAEAGMDDHLGKPFRAAELGAVLARWGGRTRRESRAVA